MTHRYVKVGITAVVLIGAFVILLSKSLASGTEFFMDVHEVMADPAAWQGKTMRLHGHVVANSIMVRPDTLEYKFKVQSNGTVIDATYTGIVPDTFKDRPGEEAELVLRGQLTPAGFHVEPNGVTAKCPSKYEAVKKVS